MRKTNYRYLTQSAQISNYPTLVYAVSFTTAAAGVGVILYDAPDADTSNIMLHLHELANREVTVTFNPPLRTTRGLYVTLEGNVDNCTIQYAPDTED